MLQAQVGGEDREGLERLATTSGTWLTPAAPVTSGLGLSTAMAKWAALELSGGVLLQKDGYLGLGDLALSDS